MVHDEEPALMNREELRQFLAGRGFRMSKSRFSKLCSPSIGEGPKAEGYFGKRPLYDPRTALAWALARLASGSPPKSTSGGSKPKAETAA